MSIRVYWLFLFRMWYQFRKQEAHCLYQWCNPKAWQLSGTIIFWRSTCWHVDYIRAILFPVLWERHGSLVPWYILQAMASQVTKESRWDLFLYKIAKLSIVVIRLWLWLHMTMYASRLLVSPMIMACWKQWLWMDHTSATHCNLMEIALICWRV